MVPGRATRATEEQCFGAPLLIGGDPFNLKPLTVVKPFVRFDFSNVMEDGPASEIELIGGGGGVDTLSEREIYILSVEEGCVYMEKRGGGVVAAWFTMRCLL